jgi:hypothetical protein
MSVKPSRQQMLSDRRQHAKEGVYSTRRAFGVGSSVAAVALAVSLSGCVTTFHEDHYFQSVNSRSGRATNYFRLGVDGWAAFSSARYISGYYDERAVDLFFNEIKAGGAQPPKLFEQEAVEPGGTEKLKPLSPEDKNGALIMVFSTNAKAVTDAIGQFSESQVVADSLTNLLNRRDVLDAQRANARLGPEIDRATAVASELTRLFAAMPAPIPPNVAPTELEARDAQLRILNAIAAALGSTQSIATIQQAEAWLRAAAQAERPR